jgi:hypothetical protein
MQMRSLRGTNLVACGYDAVTGTLRTRFNKSGEYDYSGVPEEKFVSLCRVPFPDSYYHKAIKGKFPCVKVEDLQEEPNGHFIGNVQNTAGRDSDDGDDSAREKGPGERRCVQVDSGRFNGRSGIDGERYGAGGKGIAGNHASDGSSGIPVGGLDAQSAGGRLMEIYYAPDVTFQEDGHAYFLKGQRIPFSLTQILDLSGISRKPTEPSEIAAWPAAARRGTKVHEYTLWLDQGELDLEDLKPYPEYYNRVIGWQQFREDFRFDPDLTMCEVPIAVRVNGMLYAMKLDAYGVIGEGDNLAMAVVEKKCTANEEDSHAIQTAGQAIAFKDHAESLQMPLKRYVVYLFDKLNAANRYYRAVEHTDRSDEKVFAGAGLTNVYWRSQHGLLK